MTDYSEKIEELVSDRKKFNETVYTDVWEAVKEIKKRWEDKGLEKKVNEYLGGDIPKPLVEGFKAVLCRNSLAPNYELHRFISLVDGLDWNPLFFGYSGDKFTSNNPNKYYLGRMGFHLGYGKNGGTKREYRNIIDFNQCNGVPFHAVKTIWGQPILKFYEDLFLSKYSQFGSDSVFDAIDWFNKNGNYAKEYYKKLLALFIRNGILFENFLLNNGELSFTKEYFLPAFFKVWDKMGVKPLIVALEPTEIEDDEFWMCYPPEVLAHVDKKLENEKQTV